jgi:pimeloyl-ACP methyl ester carboxylesterase
MVKILDALGIERAHVLGHSWVFPTVVGDPVADAW